MTYALDPATQPCQIDDDKTNKYCNNFPGCYSQNSSKTYSYVQDGVAKTGYLYCVPSTDSYDQDSGMKMVCQAKSDGSRFSYTEIFIPASLTGGVVNFEPKNWQITNIGADNCSYIQSFDEDINIKLNSPNLEKTSPGQVIKSISDVLYYFSIFFFIILMLTNAFAYVRSGEDPAKLKEIKASIFNTIAGFLFVILSGSLIINLIQQIG